MAASSTEIARACAAPTRRVSEFVVSEPNAPKSTLANERFMALLIRIDRMNPDAPSSAPAMMSTTLSIAKPVAHAASPEYELSNATTTGMSAPPIGMTSNMPATSARPIIV